MIVDAILWDYDGTLVNSVPKNMDITKEILAKVAPRIVGSNLPKYLQNEKEYHVANHQSKNWQDLYLHYYGLTKSEMLSAGALWSEYQLKNTTPVELFPEIKETILQINIPQGICSQNSADTILKLLEKNYIADKFNSIIGYDDIPFNRQKPDSFSGIKCLNRIFEQLKEKTIIYIGDHESDVLFSRNIEKDLEKGIKIISVAVIYSGVDISLWTMQPDYVLESPQELIKLLKEKVFK